jgi:hypothetical protein
MSRRTVVVFWTAVAIAALLLGGAVSSVRAALSHLNAASLVPLVLSVIALSAALFVGARVVFVLARAERGRRVVVRTARKA